MEGDPPNEERLCWRPWPCSACGDGLSPADYLVDRLGTGETIPESFEQVRSRQLGLLRNWIECCSHRQPATAGLEKIDEGSEHLVYLDAPASEVIKVTKPGLFGEHYYLQGGLVYQESSSPLEYLQRLQYWDDFFSAAPVPIGMSEQGQIVSRQEFIVGVEPTQAEVDDYVKSEGFIAVKQNCWLWKHTFAGEAREIWLGDARADNFVLTKAGIVPIDIRLWFMANS